MPIDLRCVICRKEFSTRKRGDRIIQACSKECGIKLAIKKNVAREKKIHDEWEKEPRSKTIAIMRKSFEKFFEKTDGCWEWKGHRKNKLPYGNFTFRGKQFIAHRASYEIYKGKIPEGMLVLHSCDAPQCVNFRHLRVGTYLDNQRDKLERGRGKVEKLSIDDVKEIKKRLDMGVRPMRLVRDFGVCYQTIWSIQTGKTWSWVD